MDSSCLMDDRNASTSLSILPFGLERYTQVHDLALYFNTLNRPFHFRVVLSAPKFYICVFPVFEVLLYKNILSQNYLYSYLCLGLNNYGSQLLIRFFRE